MELADYKHDLLRNIGAILSGAQMVRRTLPDNESRMQKLLEQMEIECESSLELIKKLFNNKNFEEEK